MDHPSMNPQLHIINDTMGPPMIDEDTNYIYSAWGPYENSRDNLVEFVTNHYIVGFKSICEDVQERRWIIFESTNTAFIAQGPFTFDVDHMVMNGDGWILGIRLGHDNRFVETRGLQGKSCFDFFNEGKFWVISMLRDLDEGQSFCAPPSIPFSCDVVVGEANIDPTLDPHIQRVKGHVSQALLEEHVDTRLVEIDTLCEGEPNYERIVEPQSSHLVDFIGDGTNLGATRRSEVLSSLTPDSCLEIGHSDQIPRAGQDGAHLSDEESQTLGPLPDDLNLFHNDELFAMFRDLESNQAFQYELERQQTVEEAIVSIPNLGDNNEPTRKIPWMDKPEHHAMMEATRIFEATIGDDANGEAWTMSKEAQAAKPSSWESALCLNALRGATSSNEVNSLEITGMGSNGIEDMAFSTLDVLTETQESNALHPLLDQGPSSSTKYQSVNHVGNVEDISKDEKIEGHMVEGTGNNSNEDMAFVEVGVLMENEEGNTLLDQGPSSSIEYQSVNHVGNIVDVSKDGEIEGHMVGGTMATMNTSSQGCNSIRKRPRQSRLKLKFKHHGVKRRGGGRESFVVYFKPKDLPDSDKRFLTIGEFTDEAHAWYAFNLFAFVHEGEDSCINMEDKKSIEEDAPLWREKPRVDLVAHLRLEGRGYFKSDDLPSDLLIDRYKNIKFRKNVRGIDKGKIQWFCDIHLAKGVTDPNVGNGTKTKETFTYETAEAAAKEADRLVMLNEGHMAWTNFSILNYMKDAEKNLWDPMWIPLQDNPKKYLSTAKYNSQFL